MPLPGVHLGNPGLNDLSGATCNEIWGLSESAREALFDARDDMGNAIDRMAHDVRSKINDAANQSHDVVNQGGVEIRTGIRDAAEEAARGIRAAEKRIRDGLSGVFNAGTKDIHAAVDAVKEAANALTGTINDAEQQVSQGTSNSGFDDPVDARSEGRVDTKINTKDPEKLGEDRIIDAGGDGMLTGKSVQLSHLERCGYSLLEGTEETRYESADGALSLGWEFGGLSTDCPGFINGRVPTQADFMKACGRTDKQAFTSTQGFLPVCSKEGPPPADAPRQYQVGLDGMAYSLFCTLMHHELLASSDLGLINSKLLQGGYFSIVKYDRNTQKLECFYLMTEQAVSLVDQQKAAAARHAPP